MAYMNTTQGWESLFLPILGYLTTKYSIIWFHIQLVAVFPNSYHLCRCLTTEEMEIFQSSEKKQDWDT